MNKIEKKQVHEKVKMIFPNLFNMQTPSLERKRR